jgi:hypothetical protein
MSVEELALAGQFPHALVSYAKDDDLQASLQPLGYMKRIEVDFNTLTSEPVDLVKLGQSGTPNGDQLPLLCDGERVVLWEPGLEVEATVIYDASQRYWLARPDEATWRDIPLSPDIETRLRHA